MKTYRFVSRSTRQGFTQWAEGLDNGRLAERIDRDVHQETVRVFRERAARVLEEKGYQYDSQQYSL